VTARALPPEDPRDAELRLSGQRLVLMPERCVYWPARRWLLAADLHWGKCQAMRARGVPLPGGPLEADLDRLAAAMARTGARRLIVLGDLVHDTAALTAPVLGTLARWRAGSGDRPAGWLALIPGNHDRGLVAPACRGRGRTRAGTLSALGVRTLPSRLRVGRLVLTHQPPEKARRPLADFSPPAVVCGHLHPVASLGGAGPAGDRLRLAAFWLHAPGPRPEGDKREDEAGGTLVLPAFSGLADGRAIAPGPHDALWVTTGQSVRRVR